MFAELSHLNKRKKREKKNKRAGETKPLTDSRSEENVSADGNNTVCFVFDKELSKVTHLAR